MFNNRHKVCIEDKVFVAKPRVSVVTHKYHAFPDAFPDSELGGRFASATAGTSDSETYKRQLFA